MLKKNLPGICKYRNKVRECLTEVNMHINYRNGSRKGSQAFLTVRKKNIYFPEVSTESNRKKKKQHQDSSFLLENISVLTLHTYQMTPFNRVCRCGEAAYNEDPKLLV